jgi:hypothetical protein
MEKLTVSISRTLSHSESVGKAHGATSIFLTSANSGSNLSYRPTANSNWRNRSGTPSTLETPVPTNTIADVPKRAVGTNEPRKDKFHRGQEHMAHEIMDCRN